MELTKYSVTQGGDDLNWNKILEQDSYTREEVDQMKDLAGSWISCAVGNTCSIIPRDVNGSPVDSKLKEYGNNFYDDILALRRAVNDDNENEIAACQEDAKCTLELIEKRSSHLIKKIINQQSNV